MCFQATFCIITAALISGAIVERMRFSAYVVFITLWSLVVYAPIAHWVWGGGWLAKMGALDFAGGTVVHVNAGVAALVAAITVGARRDFKKAGLMPHNVPFVLLGSGLLWFGWFGFNSGSALLANGIAGLAFATTMLAPAGTLVVWTLLDLMRQGKATAVGAATAIVVGLVAVTPAAGFISPMNAILLGGDRRGAELLRPGDPRARRNLDDSLDVVAAHGVGGTVGALLTGVFAQKSLNGLADGLLYGNPGQLGDPGDGHWRDDRLQRRREVHPAQGHRRGAPAARGRGRGERRPRQDATRRRSLRARAEANIDVTAFHGHGHVRRSISWANRNLGTGPLHADATVPRSVSWHDPRTKSQLGRTWNGEPYGSCLDQLMQEQADVGDETDRL